MTNHELEKLDNHLQLPIGTTYEVIIQHNNPIQLNKKLKQYSIELDDLGFLPKHQINNWTNLMKLLNIDKRYWKNSELLIEDQVIEEL